MKSWVLALCAVIALVACQEAMKGEEIDLGIDMGCFNGGEDLAWQFSTLVTVKDAKTMAFIADPVFKAGTETLSAKCFSSNFNADLSGDCMSEWSIADSTRDYQLEVSAPGYAAQTISIAHDYSIGPCPAQRQVRAEVHLDSL